MFYKFGIEAFNGSIVSLATNRYDRDAFQSGTQPRTFEKVGLIVGLNQAAQCLGSILISPLTKSCPTRWVLSSAIFLFALFSALLLILDASTGGRIKPTNFQPFSEHDFSYYGRYPTNILIPIYCLTGIAYGMVELIRRVIPQEIVGSNEEKLQRMDSLVHIFYEISGVSGALLTALVLIPKLGNNYSFLISPILFTVAAVCWFFLRLERNESKTKKKKKKKKNYLRSFLNGFILFGQSVYLGGKLIFTRRKYIWFFPCYTLTLYIHRYLENGLAPQIAKRFLQNSEWSQIIVAGSNSGELIGACVLFFLAKRIRSPVVWLRIDCLLLLICWYLPFSRPSMISVKNAWLIALIFLPFGFGAAADEISLNAHLQSILDQSETSNPKISALGSVMSFLYSSYIILYAVLNPLLGKYVDHVYSTSPTIRPALIYTAGVQITVVSLVVFLSTFIPKGSFKINPTIE